MASKDYVKRGSSAKRPARKSTKKTPSPRSPLKSGFFAVVVIAAFGYGLHFLNSQPESAKPVPVQPPKEKAKPKPSQVQPEKKKSALPPPPKEHWEYVDDLPKRKIEVVPKKQDVSKVPYIMQCGAYKDKSKTEQRKLDIAFHGLKSDVRKKPDSEWYRVVLGPYKHRREADRDKYKLQRAKIEPCAIWKAR